jgi:hypothetical protein
LYWAGVYAAWLTVNVQDEVLPARQCVFFVCLIFFLGGGRGRVFVFLLPFVFAHVLRASSSSAVQFTRTTLTTTKTHHKRAYLSLSEMENVLYSPYNSYAQYELAGTRFWGLV